MGYPFPPEVAEKVRRLMESGKYQSEEELVVEAFEALDDRDTHAEEIRRKLAAGAEELDQGLGVPFDLKVILERVNAKYHSKSNVE
jgi:Arc/MetJ-type ribon-helix-helix transcriptional regulator